MQAAPDAPPQPPATHLETIRFDKVEPLLPQLRATLRTGNVSGLAQLLAATTELILLARAALERSDDPLLAIRPIAQITIRRALAQVALGGPAPLPKPAKRVRARRHVRQ